MRIWPCFINKPCVEEQGVRGGRTEEMCLVKMPLSQRWDCVNNPSLEKATGVRLWHLLSSALVGAVRLARRDSPDPTPIAHLPESPHLLHIQGLVPGLP